MSHAGRLMPYFPNSNLLEHVCLIWQLWHEPCWETDDIFPKFKLIGACVLDMAIMA